MARLVLRRLVGPLKLRNPAEPNTAWVEWETTVTADLLDGLVQTGNVPNGARYVVDKGDAGETEAV